MALISLSPLNPSIHGLVQQGRWEEIGAQVAQGLSPHVLATPMLTVMEEFLRQAGSAVLPVDMDEDAVFFDLLSGLKDVDPHRPTPLALACLAGRPRWVQALLDKGCNPNEKGEGHTALTALATQGLPLPLRIEALPQLPEYGWNRQERLMAQVSCVDLLLKAGARINEPSSDGASPLILACLAKNTRLAMALLSRGAHPRPVKHGLGIFSASPLEVSIVSHNEGLFRMLLEVGADPFEKQLLGLGSSRGLTLVEVASGWGLPGMLDFLDEHLEDKRGMLSQAWWVALEKGNRPVIDWYLRQGVDLRVCDSTGSHVSHVLARNGHFDLLSDFFRRGLCLTSPDAQGNTALDVWAVYHPEQYRQARKQWRGLPGNVVAGKFPLTKDNKAPE